ncbi:nitroreductase family protein [Paenibacillus flagellatus]|uniref:Putative NAD(P)H nitroreductase n=1 Tax=Paenibacillus flagellatus TaxID=2211139 RepID=A0A2V5KA01_9BACL|nr:nitroreductase [Paenibacillus flagellatus]PYI50650.1 nitroreductase [Paenibacillus flagellatus]
MTIAQTETGLARLMKERRSVHQFESREVDVGLVEELLDTSVWAPNHRLTQPWRFVLVRGEGRRRIADIARRNAEKRESDPAKRAELGQTFYDRFMNVPLILVVVMSENPNMAVREEDYAAVSCLIQNFSLLAWEQGIGLVWESYPLLTQTEFRDTLGIGLGERAVASLHMGYPAKVPPAQPRIPASERLTIVDTP